MTKKNEAADESEVELLCFDCGAIFKADAPVRGEAATLCPSCRGEHVGRPSSEVGVDPSFASLAAEVASLVAEKNQAYGSSFDTCGEFLGLLWPDGANPEDFGDLLAFARMFDKMSRIATAEDAFGEEPAADLLGYALLLLRRKRRAARDRGRE